MYGGEFVNLKLLHTLDFPMLPRMAIPLRDQT